MNIDYRYLRPEKAKALKKWYDDPVEVRGNPALWQLDNATILPLRRDESFGLLFGKGVFAQYQQKGADFVPVYNQLLRSCGSDTVANVAASVGIDVHSVDFWRQSLRVIEKDIELFIQLADEQTKG